MLNGFIKVNNSKNMDFSNFFFVIMIMDLSGLFLGHPLAKPNYDDKYVNITWRNLYAKNVPQYLHDLYKSFSSLNTSKNLLFNGNVARSYNDLSALHSRIHFFDVSDIANSQEVLKRAELRLFKGHSARYRFLTTILQIKVTNTLSNKTVSSKIISSTSYGWQVFPITEVVQDWIDSRAKNNGLYITIRKLYGANMLFNFKTKYVRHKPFLITFTKEKKELSLISLLKKNEKRFMPTVENDLAKRKRRVVADNAKVCGVEPLNVPLELIDWQKLFIYPTHFIINHCKGFCYHKNDKDNDEQTSHSILQALYADVLQNDIVKYPCCAPTKFLPGTALIIDRSSVNEVIKLVQLENLTVTECKCL
ncbi:protein DVR-1 homolog isoform X1 [Hydra vulgaris]|uniref:protein DVR-1 homolog isoform X1 n=1 Tax=Hydra vulgaris TaxID=6087 RepID=UPI001F5ED237|nr:protein DVR-1 homolog [Hydra vulgaris]